MIKTAIFLADGFEEVEGLTVVDMLRRAGIPIDMVSITGKKEVTGSHHITVTADCLIESLPFEEYSYLILPGGMPGTKNLEACKTLTDQLTYFAENGKHVAAICAAPSVLGHLGILKGKKACCYPSFEKELTGADVSFDRAVTDGNVITSRGLGTAIHFASAIIADINGKDAAGEIEQAIVYESQLK